MPGPAAQDGVDGQARQTKRPPSQFPRFRQALPSLRVTLIGAALWACAAAASAAVNLLTAVWGSPDKILAVVALYAAGSAVAFPLAYACARLIASNGGRETRFAAAFLCFTAVTIAITAAVYALDYRQYYAHWHASAFSFTWLLQFVFTTLGALFQFSVTGVRLYFPVGFFALLAVSFWFARHRR